MCVMEDIQDVIAESAREETDMSNMIGVSFSPLNTKNPTPLSKEREHSSDKSKKPKTNSTTTKRKKKGNIPHPFDHLILDQNWDDEEEVSMLTIPKALRDLAKKIKKGNNTQSGDNIKVQELENAIKPQRKTKTSTGESSLDDDINAILQNSKQKQEERQQKLLLVSTRKFRLGKDKNGSNESTKESSPETSLEDEKEIPAKEMAQTKAKKNAKSAITKPQEYLILDNDWDGEEVSLLTIPKPLRDLAKIIKNKKEGEDGNKTQTQDPKNTHEALVIPKVSIGQLVLTVEIKEEDKPSIRNDSSTPVPPRDLTPSKKFRKRSISEMTQKTTMEIADSQKKKNDKSTGTDLKQEIKERNHRTAEDLKNKSAIPSSKTKGNKRKKRANGANGLSNKTGVKSKAFQGRICSADKEKEISQKTQKCIHIISPMDEEVVLTLSELVGTPKNSASPETPTFIIRNDCVEQRNDTSRSNAIVLAKQPREDEEMGYIDEDIIIDTNRSAPGSAPRRQARASQVEMPQKQNYEQESENDDDISETSRRRSRVLCFIWICVCCLLFAIILIVVAVLLVKNDDNKMVESSPLPVNTSGEVESETDDDFFYTDELIVSPGLITTEMAEFDYDCDYNDQDGYPHVWDQCNCDGVISDVPEDVANLREELIIRLLPQVYGGNNYNAPISSCNPSNMALLWLASGKNRDTGNLRQRFVLALSFFAMGGPSWDYRDGWLTPLNECLWLGCQCNDWDVVNSFAIDTNNIFGTIPTELGSLEGLAGIYISRNHLTGAIPTEIFLLTRLRELWLYGNRLSGTIPTEIAYARSLKSLLIHTNFFQGSIPTEIGGAKKLTDLNAGFNSLSRNIPEEIGMLTGLKYLTLSHNQLSGQVPSEIGHMASLQNMTLSENLLFGSIPSEFGKLNNLVDLRLSRAGMGGFLPSELGVMSKLAVLELTQSNFRGIIPTELGKLSRMSNLQLYKNDLEGTIPTEMGDMAYLVELRLNDNFLTGTLPSQFGKLTKLESITLDGNDLSGSAPNEVCGLNYLGVLDTFAVDCVNDRTGLGIICPSNTCCSFCRDNA